MSLRIEKGERVAVVGKSGSGKTMTGLSLMGLVPAPGEVSGSVRFKARELVGLSERELTEVCGAEMGPSCRTPWPRSNLSRPSATRSSRRSGYTRTSTSRRPAGVPSS